MSNSLVESTGTWRPMLRLTLPVLLEQILHLLVQYVDFFLTGRYLAGDEFLAAMTLALYAAWFITNLFAFVGIGATAMTARFVGGGDRETANRVMNQSLTTGGLWAAALMAVAFPLATTLIATMELHGVAAEAAAQYLRYELVALPAIMIERVGVACLRAPGTR